MNFVLTIFNQIQVAYKNFSLSIKGLDPVGGQHTEKTLQLIMYIGVLMNAMNKSVEPVVKIFMYSGLDQQLLAFCLLVESFIAFIMKGFIGQHNLPTIRKHFIAIIIIDAIIFINVNIFFGYDANIRKLAITFLCPIASNLVGVLFNEMVNHLFNSPTKLTVAEQKFGAANTLAFIIGGLLAMATVVTSIEVALAVQCLVVLIDVTVSLMITRRLMHLYCDKDGNEIETK